MLCPLVGINYTFDVTQVLCWGVRDMKKLQLLPVDSPLVEVECGGATGRSQHIKDTKRNPNFPQPVFHFDVVSIVMCKMLQTKYIACIKLAVCFFPLQELPEDPRYCPPLNVQIFDKRTFSRLSLAGTHVIKSIDQFLIKEGNANDQTDSSTQVTSTPRSVGEYYSLA